MLIKLKISSTAKEILGIIKNEDLSFKKPFELANLYFAL